MSSSLHNATIIGIERSFTLTLHVIWIDTLYELQLCLDWVLIFWDINVYEKRSLVTMMIISIVEIVYDRWCSHDSRSDSMGHLRVKPGSSLSMCNCVLNNVPAVAVDLFRCYSVRFGRAQRKLANQAFLPSTCALFHLANHNSKGLVNYCTLSLLIQLKSTSRVWSDRLRVPRPSSSPLRTFKIARGRYFAANSHWGKSEQSCKTIFPTIFWNRK